MHFGSFGATYGETGTGVPAHNGELEEQNNNLVYSVRKVVPSYTGYAMRIRRSSDDAEADISFNSANTISTSSVAILVADGSTSTLGTFTSGTDAYVVDWYNQCRNTNAVVAPTTGTTMGLKTDNKLSLSGDFTITLTLVANYTSFQGTGLLGWILHALESNNSAGDGIGIQNNGSGRGGYLKCYINGSTITASNGRITDTGSHTFVISRSSGTVTFTLDGSSQGTVSNSEAISVNKNTFIGSSENLVPAINEEFTVSEYTVVDGSTTVYDIKDSYIFNASAYLATAQQPKIVSNGAVMVNGNSNVALEFDGSDNFLSPASYLSALKDTNTGYLCYAEADSTSVSSGNIKPIISQYQESSGTPIAGAFYLGVDENGWSAFLQSSTDGLNINTSGTSTITRPTILGLGKPNSSSGTATFFRTDSTNGVYSEATDTFNQSINTFYTSIGQANKTSDSEFFDGHISEIIVLNGGSTDETRRAFNEQRNYWGF